MDIGRALPKPTQLSAFLFVPYAELTVEGNGAGILLCIGITSDEMMYLRENGYDDLLGKLKDAGVYPYTNLSRGSILQER